MNSALRRRGTDPRPRRAPVSYPAEQPSATHRSPISPDACQARVLARLATAGHPLELHQFRDCDGLRSISSTRLCAAIISLIELGLVEAREQSELVVIDGIRCRRDFTLYRLARQGGGEP